MNLWHELPPGPNPPEVINTIVEIPKYLFNNNLGFCGRGSAPDSAFKAGSHFLTSALTISFSRFSNSNQAG